ncbi:MAG: acyltransferase [Candidatus Lokiarchaeota archaeon]|nr:acyltransferase [Candidatus Lokiarchaeota archaeon]
MENSTFDKKDISENVQKLSSKESRYWQIDFLKVFAMLLVIMDHSTSYDDLLELASPYWQRIAIPLFLIILGFNWSKSMEQHKNKSLRYIYSWNVYFKKKMLRFILPFAIIYLLSIILLIIQKTIPTIPQMYISYYADPMLKIFLFLPVWGPGNWFIPLLFLTILIFPLMHKAFMKQPVMALVGCFLVELLYYLIIFVVRIFWQNRGYVPVGSWNYYNTLTIIRCTPFRAMSAIGLGIWLSIDHNWFSRRNIVIWVLGGLSAVYLFFYTFAGYRSSIFIGDYSMLHFPWSALLVMLALNLFPKGPKGKQNRFIRLLSNSTYHILMVQIFYFSIIYNYLLPLFGDNPIWAHVGGENYKLHYLWYYPVNVIFTFSVGGLWYNLEKKYIWQRMTRIDKNRLDYAKARGWIK